MRRAWPRLMLLLLLSGCSDSSALRVVGTPVSATPSASPSPVTGVKLQPLRRDHEGGCYQLQLGRAYPDVPELRMVAAQAVVCP